MPRYYKEKIYDTLSCYRIINEQTGEFKVVTVRDSSERQRIGSILRNKMLIKQSESIQNYDGNYERDKAEATAAAFRKLKVDNSKHLKL